MFECGDIGKQKKSGGPLGRIDTGFVNLFLSLWKKELSLCHNDSNIRWERDPVSFQSAC